MTKNRRTTSTGREIPLAAVPWAIKAGSPSLSPSRSANNGYEYQQCSLPPAAGIRVPKKDAIPNPNSEVCSILN